MKRFTCYRMFKLAAMVTIALLLTTMAGPSHTASAAIRQVNYTALGDSLAFGLFALPGRGYVPLYATGLQNAVQMRVNLFQLGVPGWTSADLVDALRNNAVFKLFVFSSDVVTLDIGGNDLSRARSSFKAGTCGGGDNQDCLRTAVAAFQLNWNGILTEILQLRHGRPTVLRTMDIYNPFVAEDTTAGDFVILNGYLTQVNDTIHSTAGIAPYARVYEAFNTSFGSIVDPRTKDLLSFDGFHPNTRGHALIAAKLAETGYASIIL